MLWLNRHQLKSRNAVSRRRAAEQLCQNPDPAAFRALTLALRDADAEVRRLAARGLGKLEEERCIGPLLGVLKDENAEVLQAAILALKRNADERVVAALPALLRHSDAGVRAYAAQVLEALGWRPAAPDEELWLAISKGQMVRAASFGSASIEALESVLVSSPPGLRVAAIEALASVGGGERSLRALLEALKSPEAVDCIAAVGAIRKIGGEQVVEALIGLLGHKDGYVRVAVVEALGTVNGGDTAVEPLLNLLTDPVWDVRRATAETLGRLGDAAAVESLAGALQDSDADVREAAVMALASLRDHRGVGPLILVLKDPISRVRRLAAGALARIDPEWSSLPEAGPAFEALKPALEAADSNVRHFVGQLLAGLGAVEGKASRARKADSERTGVPKTPGHQAVSLFLPVLGDPDRDLRQAAAESLGRLGDQRAEVALVRALADADPGVCRAAEEALQALRLAGLAT